MILLTISSDRNLFKEGSDVWNRYLDYGKLFGEIHVIVFSHKNLGNKNAKIGDNVFVYPTNHIFRVFYLCKILKIAKGVLGLRCPKCGDLEIDHKTDSWAITAQDPFEAGFAGWILKKIYKIPLQIQIHTDLLSRYFGRESLLNKLRVILAKFLISRADGIRVVSERIRRSLIESRLLCVAKIDVLPIFVDVKSVKNAQVKIDIHKKYPQFNFIILMASRLTKEKNIGLAIEVIAELVKKYSKIGLVVCGKGPELKNLKFKTFNLQLNENVKFEDWSNDLFSYYKTADLFLLTSNYEGYGRSVAEVMSAGLPVVMTDVGLAGEVLINDKNGIVIPVGDKKALVSAADLLINDNKKRNLFSCEGKKAVEDLMAKEGYLKLYKKSFNF